MTRRGQWLLDAGDRGNDATTIDSQHGGIPWTVGNHVAALVDGRTYFARLCTAFDEMQAGDLLLFTDWRGDADEQLDEHVDAGGALAALCRRGVDVRGLVWRSHSDRLSFSARENRHIADDVVEAGGEALLDERVRRGGSHHQKLVVARHLHRPDRDVAFVGGIDLSHGRRDTARHLGDPQAVPLDARYGHRPPWHDVQLEVRGPAVADLELTFRERWSDPTALDHSGVVRAWFSSVASRERTPTPLPVSLPAPPPAGDLTVQVLRTYPSRRPRYAFAPEGERSVARGFLKAVGQAQRCIYVEDQYFWSEDAAHALAEAVRRRPSLLVIVVVPRYPDRDGTLTGQPARAQQAKAMQLVREAAPDRVAFYDIENEASVPIYTHAKVCVIDDTWATVGSDNINRRSWTHDSEVSCAILDDAGSTFARDLRCALWSEHLGLTPDDPEIRDVRRGFARWTHTARALDQWHSNRTGRRPPGHARVHHTDAPASALRSLAEPLYRLLLDPDGRPRRKRLDRSY